MINTKIIIYFHPSTYKLFPNTTESILFFIKDNKKFIKSFLIEKKNKLHLSAKEINDAMGVKSNGGGMWSIYTGKNVCEQMPTKEQWQKLSRILKFKHPYNKIAQTFNQLMGFTDVWRDIDFYKEKKIHPTQKPLKLIKRLIASSSNVGDNVLDPFAGCGSTLFASMELKRNCTGIEIDKQYYKKACDKINEFIDPLSKFMVK